MGEDLAKNLKQDAQNLNYRLFIRSMEIAALVLNYLDGFPPYKEQGAQKTYIDCTRYSRRIHTDAKSKETGENI